VAKFHLQIIAISATSRKISPPKKKKEKEKRKPLHFGQTINIFMSVVTNAVRGPNRGVRVDLF
jgi:hypothetical protein